MLVKPDRKNELLLIGINKIYAVAFEEKFGEIPLTGTITDTINFSTYSSLHKPQGWIINLHLK